MCFLEQQSNQSGRQASQSILLSYGWILAPEIFLIQLSLIDVKFPKANLKMFPFQRQLGKEKLGLIYLKTHG